VGYQREYFYDEATHTGQYPYDAELGIADGAGMSEGLKRALVKLCTRLPFAEACAVLDELAHIHISATKAWRETQAAGQRARPALDPRPTTKDSSQDAACMVITMDGCMANVRGEGWKEVKLGVLSEASVGQEVKYNRHNDAIRAVHSHTHSYVAHLGGPEGFGTKLLVEAQVRRWSRAYQSVVVGDGAVWIWNLATTDYASAAHVVDWYHAKQHLCAAAELIFADAPDKAGVWISDMADVLYDGRALEIAHRLELAATLAKPDTAKALLAEAGYFVTHHERMQYRDFQLAQLPIGSGTVESGAKQLKHRVSAAGMRWSRSGLENMLPLRAATMSGTFDPFWRSITPL
jgi:hypothetical protein